MSLLSRLQTQVHCLVTGQLADTPTRGLPTRALVNSQTGQLAVSQMPTKRKTKHAKSPMASATCPVRKLTSPRDVQSASWQSASCPVTKCFTAIVQASLVAVWCSGSALVLINEVNLRRARLVLGWVTVCGFCSRGHHFISVRNQTSRSMTRNVYWSRVSVCSLPHSHTTAPTRAGCCLGHGRGALWLCSIGQICYRCTGFVAMTT